MNRNWLYAPDEGGDEIVPDDFRFAVVMTFPMDEQAIATSPAMPSSAATGLGYARMTFATVSVAEFIRDLGYRAIASGNHTGMNIPFVVDAGLGEQGRHGMLLTPELGPLVRLGKVFTDLPLVPDAPVSFGALDFCKKYGKCAEACEVGAIPSDGERTFEPTATSNPGVLKWHVDSEKCLGYWAGQATAARHACVCARLMRRRSGETPGWTRRYSGNWTIES